MFSFFDNKKICIVCYNIKVQNIYMQGPGFESRLPQKNIDMLCFINRLDDIFFNQ